MKSRPEFFSRYLPTDQQAHRWGWRLLDAGRQSIPLDADYPPKGHPQNYLFDATGKRVLNEYQIIFIATGNGTFESEQSTLMRVHSGEAIILFPGQWHRYRPDPRTGWSEYWLGFRGQDAERVMDTFFNKKKAIHRSSHPNEVIRLFDQLLHWAKNPFPGMEQVMASFIPMILAFLNAGDLKSGYSTNNDSQLILSAKSYMLKDLTQRSDLNRLANSLGMSYSKFRMLFKQQTGYAPREFENLIKLNRACDLLRSNQYSVTQTAEALGYTSIYYFSRAFKRQFGKAPQQWVQQYRNN